MKLLYIGLILNIATTITGAERSAPVIIPSKPNACPPSYEEIEAHNARFIMQAITNTRRAAESASHVFDTMSVLRDTTRIALVADRDHISGILKIKQEPHSQRLFPITEHFFPETTRVDPFNTLTYHAFLGKNKLRAITFIENLRSSFALRRLLSEKMISEPLGVDPVPFLKMHARAFQLIAIHDKVIISSQTDRHLRLLTLWFMPHLAGLLPETIAYDLFDPKKSDLLPSHSEDKNTLALRQIMQNIGNALSMHDKINTIIEHYSHSPLEDIEQINGILLSLKALHATIHSQQLSLSSTLNHDGRCFLRATICALLPDFIRH